MDLCGSLEQGNEYWDSMLRGRIYSVGELSEKVINKGKESDRSQIIVDKIM